MVIPGALGDGSKYIVASTLQWIISDFVPPCLLSHQEKFKLVGPQGLSIPGAFLGSSCGMVSSDEGSYRPKGRWIDKQWCVIWVAIFSGFNSIHCIHYSIGTYQKTYTHMCIQVCVSINFLTHIHNYIYAHQDSYMFICIYIHIYKHMYIYINMRCAHVHVFQLQLANGLSGTNPMVHSAESSTCVGRLLKAPTLYQCDKLPQMIIYIYIYKYMRTKLNYPIYLYHKHP